MDKLTQMTTRRKINLDITHRCTLECPRCLRQSIKPNKIPGEDLSLNDFKKILNHFDKIQFCGQISDPIFHPQFIRFLELSKNKDVKVNTAASHRPMSWYMKAFNANKNAEWEFGIDGLPEESHKYRINQDGKKLFEVMKQGIKNGNNILWQYIIFKYNENHVDQAIELAKNNNIKLIITQSSRWIENDPYKPTKLFIDTTYPLKEKNDKTRTKMHG